MASTSDNMYDTFVWIKKVIDSTTTHKQFENAYKLIELFNKKYDTWILYIKLSEYTRDHIDNLKDYK